MRNNKRGQMGMNFIVGILIMVLSFVLFMALMPVMSNMIGVGKGSNGANCRGYTDPNGVYSYNSTLNSDTVTCSILDLQIPALVLAVLCGLIAGVISGRLGQSEPQPQYQVPGGY